MKSNTITDGFRFSPHGFAYLEIPDEKFTNDPEYKFSGVNPAFERMTGMGAEQFTGKTIRRAFPKEGNTKSDWESLFDRIANNKGIAEFEHFMATSGTLYQVNAWRTDDFHCAVTFTEIMAGDSRLPNILTDVYQRVFWDNNLLGIMVADKEGNYVDANMEACRMTGYSCEELKSISLFQLVDPNWIDEAHTHFQQIEKTGKAYGEVAYFTKNGERRWWNVVATKLSGGYYIGLHEDITGRKMMEQELSRNVEFNKKLLSSIPDVVIQTNLDGIITFVNEPLFIDYPFITSELLIGRNILSFAAPGDLGRMEENVRKMFEKPLGIKEYTLRFGDGIELYCEANGDVFRDKHGNPTGMVFVIRDITERKEAEKALKESEERFRLMIKNISAIIVTLDINGIQQFVSPAAEKITGYTPEELTGKSISEVIHPDDLPLVMKAWKEGTENPNTEITVQYRHIHKTKGWVFLETVGQSFLNEPAVNAVIAIVHDITERRQTEEALQLRSVVLDQIKDHVTITDLKGVITYVNNAVYETTKRTSSEIIGKSTQVYGEDPVRGATQQEILSHTLQKGDWRGEVVNYSADGSEHIMDCRTRIVYNELGTPIALSGIATDITERKRAEEALVENELKFRTLYENSGDAIFLMKGDIFMDCNLRTLEVYGCQRPDQILGKTPFDFSPAQQPNGRDSREYATEIIEKAIAGQTQLFEWVHTKLDGTVFIAEVKLNKLEINNQIWLQAIVRDISLRKRLEKTNQSLLNIIEMSQDFIGVAGEGKNAFFVNPAGQAMVGLDSDEAVAKTSIEEYFFEEDLPFVKETIFPVLYSQGRWSGEFRFRHFKTGEAIPILYDLFLTENPETGKLTNITTISRNISERVYAEELLKESEERFRLAMLASRDGLWDWDLSSNKVYYSPGWLHILGESQLPEMLISWEERIHPEDKTGTLSTLREHLDGKGEFWQHEHRLRVNGEHWKWVLGRGRVMTRDEHGNPLRMVGTMTDISERKQGEEALRKSESMFKKVFEVVPIGLWIADKNGTLIQGNPAGVKIWGMEPKVGQEEYGIFKARRLPSGEEIEPDDWALTHTIRKGVTISDELLEIDAFDGEKKIILNYTAPILDEKGDVEGAIIVNHNITRRMQAEKELRKLSQAIEQSPASIIIFNTEGVIEYVNPKFTEVTGFRPDEVFGQKPKSLTTSEQPAKINAELWNTISSGKEWKGEFYNQKKNGEFYWEAVSISPIYSESGTITHFIEVKEDITQRKWNELEIERSRAELRAIYDNAPVMMAVIDESRNLLFANPSFTAFTGVPEAELKGGRACGVFGCINALEDPKGCGFGIQCQSCKLLQSIEDSFITGNTHKDIEYNTTLMCGNSFKDISLLGSVAPIHFAGKSLCLLSFVDISDRKQAERDLRKSEERFILAMKASNDGLFDWNLETNTIYYSPGWKKMLGYEDHELPNDFEVWQSHTDPGDVKKSWELQQKLITKQIDRFVLEFKMKHKDGHWVDILSRAEAIFNDSEKAVRIVGTHTDISAQKQAEAELIQFQKTLAEKEAQYRLLAENSQDLIYVYVLFPEPHYEYISPSCLQLTGYSPEEGYADPFAYHKYINTPSGIEKFTQFLLDPEQPSTIEEEWLRKDGTRIWVEQVVSRNFDENGILVSFQSTVRNITKRRQAEQELREVSTRLSLATKAGGVGVWDWDCVTNTLIWDDQMYALYGISRNTFNGDFESWRSVLHPEDAERTDREISQALSSECDFNTEFRVIWPDGSVHYIRALAMVARNSDGSPLHMVGTNWDITERKQTEEALQTSDNIVRTIPSGLFIYQFAPPDKLYLLNGNPAAEQLTGLNVAGWIGKEFNELWPQARQSGLTRECIKVIETGKTFETEDLYYHDNRLSGAFRIRAFKLAGERLAVAFENITERKHAEEALKESEEKLTRLVHNLHTGIIVHAPDTHILIANEQASALLGLSIEQMMGKTAMDPAWKFIREDGSLLPLDEYPVNCVVNTLTPMFDRIVGIHRPKTNDLVWVQVAAYPEFDTSGSLIHIVVTFVDITKRKQAEDEIRKLSQAVKQSPASVVISDPQGTIEYVNPKFTEITGYTSEEAIGQTPRILNSGMHSAEMYAELWKTISTGKEWKGEFHNKRKNGELFWESALISPIKNEKGDILHYMAVKEDITERKGLEQNLIQQTRFRELLMEISSGFINIPLENVEESVNEALKKMGRFVNADRAYTFDYDWENKVCHNTYEWCNEGIDPEIQNLQNIPLSVMIEAVEEHQKGNTVCIPDVNIMPDGTAKDLIVSQGVQSFIMVPMMNQKACIGFVGFDSVNELRDYSQAEIQLLEVFARLLANVELRKDMVEQLVIAKEKAEESDRLKSAFLANMSHEIRTPMNGILGFAELLKIPGLSGSEQQEYIAIIEKSGLRMLNIINDIIDISKIEAGLMDIHLAESDIAEQMEFIHSFFKPEAEAKKLKFSVKNSLTRKETTLITDREKLYAILTNLVKNAIKYTEKGEIELGCNRKGNFLEFYVKDTGIGIPADRQQAIFERFVQADIEDTMARQGAGLGLAISRAYIKMLGGSIRLESQEGVGSTFSFTLPFEESSKEKKENRSDFAQVQDKAPASKLNILLVEDDSISELLLEIEMKKYGHRIFKVHTGTDAVEYIRNHPDTEVILMDIQLPGMNGYDATRQIRQFNQEVVIIAQTAYGMAGDRQKAIEAGCSNYIAKPIKITELLSVLRQHFRK